MREHFQNGGTAGTSAARAAGSRSATRIVVLTEDEPFYAAESFRNFLALLPQDKKVVLTVLLKFAPFGARASGAVGCGRAMRLFGPLTCMRLASLYLRYRLRPANRLASVLAEHDIPLLDGVADVNDPAVVAAVRAAEPDLAISVSTHRLFGRALRDITPCLNVHLSLLPRYGGLAPVFWALHAGDAETGVSVHLVDDGVDSGPILVQQRVAIRQRRLLPLYRELKLQGMRALVEAIRLDPKRLAAPARRAGTPADLNGVPTPADVRSFLNGGNQLL